MSVTPAQAFAPSPQDRGEPGEVRSPEPVFPPSGNRPNVAEDPTPSASGSGDAAAQDEVKLQWNSEERVPVYQFVNQQGSLILQVPSEQLLNLAQDISDELAKESAPKAPSAAEEGG